MNPGEIYAKTEEGVRELKERKRKLPITLRSLLIMIDGNRTVAQILERARALHVDAAALSSLEQTGLITRRFSAPSSHEDKSAMAPRSEKENQQFIVVQKKISDVIGAHLGFRGYVMTLRLQRAENLRDLHDLLPDFAQALVKRIGIDPASRIVSELERLIVGEQ